MPIFAPFINLACFSALGVQNQVSDNPNGGSVVPLFTFCLYTVCEDISCYKRILFPLLDCFVLTLFREKCKLSQRYDVPKSEEDA